MQCPSCGAQLELDQVLTHFAVCSYCQSALIVDRETLAIAGKMAALRPPLGPLALGFTGSIKNRSFGVLGRVRYAHGAGFWDEWYLRSEDGEAFWISQDEDRIVLEELHRGGSLPKTIVDIEPGSTLKVAGLDFVVRERGVAILEAAEGQLPFPIVPGEEHPFVDLVGKDGAFGTLEFGDDGPRLFVGKRISQSELKLDQDFSIEQVDSLNPEKAAIGSERRRVVKTSGREIVLSCESCGGSLSAPGGGETTMTCTHCGASVDLTLTRLPCPSCKSSIAVHNPAKAIQLTCLNCHARVGFSDDDVDLLETPKETVAPQTRAIGLGAPCTFSGQEYRVVGYMRLEERDEGKSYFTEEYLLHSREVGYRWLSEYSGHFSIFNELANFPPFKPSTLRKKATFNFKKRSWRVFEKGRYQIDFVDGELPWVAAVGDWSSYMDAIAPPFVLSAEWTDNELSWSEGLYLEPKEVAIAFGISVKQLPRRRGVGANQPYRSTVFKRQSLKVMIGFLIFSIVLAIWSANTGFEHKETLRVTRSEYDQEFVTQSFEITSAPSLCQFKFTADVNNAWVYLDVALLNAKDEALMDFSAEMSYYHGTEGGESWSEGSTTTDIPVRINAPGSYRLLIKGQAGTLDSPDALLGRSQYTVDIRIKEKIILTRYYIALAIFSFLWILGIVIPKASFETQRWSDE